MFILVFCDQSSSIYLFCGCKLGLFMFCNRHSSTVKLQVDGRREIEKLK